jgi:Holliday junction DNA helicase RuvA
LIGALTGRLAADEGGAVVIDVGGVGYEVTTPLGTLGRVASEDGRITLQIHTHVREDAIELFGFATASERAAFRTLLGVSHVGPKLALAVLSSLSPGQLAAAVESNDVAALTRISGVGKKTAQRIALELKGKLSDVAGAAPGLMARVKPESRDAGGGSEGGKAVVLHDALVRMGWKPSEAERAVAGLPDLDRPLADLVRDALAALSR